MDKIKCLYCGNAERFREWMIVHRYNYFIQQEDGKVFKDMVKEKLDSERDSIIICENCEQELQGELYHQFLDNYTETIFEDEPNLNKF